MLIWLNVRTRREREPNWFVWMSLMKRKTNRNLRRKWSRRRKRRKRKLLILRIRSTIHLSLKKKRAERIPSELLRLWRRRKKRLVLQIRSIILPNPKKKPRRRKKRLTVPTLSTILPSPKKKKKKPRRKSQKSRRRASPDPNSHSIHSLRARLWASAAASLNSPKKRTMRIRDCFSREALQSAEWI